VSTGGAGRTGAGRRPLVTEPPSDGRVAGDPLPLLLGAGVSVELAELLVDACADRLDPGELILGIALLDNPTTVGPLILLVTSARVARVHLGEDVAMVSVRAADFAALSFLPVEVTLFDQSVVLLGRLQDRRDRRLLEAALRNQSTTSSARTVGGSALAR